MNKNDLITLLRNPNDLKDSDLGELEKIIEANPYFLSGRLLLAKGSKELKHPDTRKRVNSAAVYSTDRPLLKKYINDKLFFLSKPPEKEELIETAVPVEKVEKVIPAEARESQKIEIKEKPKENKEVEESKDKKEERPRREPRFDPSATASFRKSWDTKDVPSAPPQDKDKDEPEKKPLFAGKKIDRSGRVRKKSIRDEVINEISPKNKLPKKEEIAPEKEPQKESPVKTIVQPEKLAEPKSKAPPQQKETPSPKKEVLLKKTEEVKKETTVDPSSASSIDKKIATNDSFFDKVDIKEEKEVKPERKESSSSDRRESRASGKEIRREPSSVKKEVASETKKEHAPVVVRTTSTLKIPEVPTGGIDSLLEELKRDMESLKTSRVKFAEVQQKIVEEDEFSEALERATNEALDRASKKVPLEKEAPSPKDVTPAQEEEIKEEEKPISEEKQKIIAKPDETKIKKSSPPKAKKIAKEKPKAKKTTSTKKKPPVKKETVAKKVSPKKSSTTKSSAKPKSSKTKTEKKEDKKDDDKSGKQKVDQSDIIDKFISESPSIKYQKKKEEVENSDLSDESTEWNKELASEYLAEIYLHQGNKKRAIEIYKALSLKFPNKKSYFADLISKTK